MISMDFILVFKFSKNKYVKPKLTVTQISKTVTAETGVLPVS